MPLPGFLTKLIGSKGGDIVSSIGGVIDNLTMSKEEKAELNIKLTEAVNKHIEVLGEQANKELELQLKDMSDARGREIQIATSDKVPLINKVITPILGLFVVASTIIIWALILFRHYEPKINEAIIIGSLTTLACGVMNYYFGSSSGSKQKSEQLDKINKL